MVRVDTAESGSAVATYLVCRALCVFSKGTFALRDHADVLPVPHVLFWPD